MKKLSLSATGLKRLLLASIALLIVLGVALFIVASGMLKTSANETTKRSIDAKISRNDVDRLRELKDKLELEREVVQRAELIVAETKFYQYQDQIVNDITAYGERAGVSILGFDFTANAAAPAAPTGTPASPPPAAAGSKVGVKSIQAAITVASPTNYRDFIEFIKAIEQNLTKMQIKSVTLTPAEDQTQIANPSISLEVYVR